MPHFFRSMRHSWDDEEKKWVLALSAPSFLWGTHDVLFRNFGLGHRRPYRGTGGGGSASSFFSDLQLSPSQEAGPLPPELLRTALLGSLLRKCNFLGFYFGLGLHDIYHQIIAQMIWLWRISFTRVWAQCGWDFMKSWNTSTCVSTLFFISNDPLNDSVATEVTCLVFFGDIYLEFRSVIMSSLYFCPLHWFVGFHVTTKILICKDDIHSILCSSWNLILNYFDVVRPEDSRNPPIQPKAWPGRGLKEHASTVSNSFILLWCIPSSESWFRGSVKGKIRVFHRADDPLPRGRCRAQQNAGLSAFFSLLKALHVKRQTIWFFLHQTAGQTPEHQHIQSHT